jgi:vacuolar protein sorting-associated protein 35
LQDQKTSAVKNFAFYMKRALDNHDLKEALKNASSMIYELRTSKLSPSNYYELYIQVTGELRFLESFVEDEHRRFLEGSGGRSMVEMYETVQHAGNIIPRLFLLMTVGSVYIRTKEVPAKEILFDLVELCRGVQHPMRGLFVRNYLSQISKDKLPDAGSEYEGEGGDVKDAIEFVLQNFGEMNKLWVRMQHQGANRERSKRERERQNLQMLVGTNLHRLAQLNGVDVQTYKDVVLPRVLEQVVNCKDTIAQEYLMDCVIQVFPDEFHLATLEVFLTACGQLQPSVNLNKIIIALMNRLSNFAQESADSIPADMELFPLFNSNCANIIKSKENMLLEDTLAMQVALANFATKVYPSHLDYVDSILNFSAQCVQRAPKMDSKCVALVSRLLTGPLETLPALAVLDLQGYAPLLSLLPFDARKSIAVEILKAELKVREPLSSVERVDKFLDLVRPLIKDESDTAPLSDDTRFEFESEQNLVSRLVHLVHSDDTDEQYRLLLAARKHFGQGGPTRIAYTLVPLVFSALNLAKRAHDREANGDQVGVASKKILQFLHQIVTALNEQISGVCLRLFLNAAHAADHCKFEAIVYEFMAQAILTYEEKLDLSVAQYSALTLIIASLQQLKTLSTESWDTLSTKCAVLAAKQLKKPDASLAVAQCSHLFWTHTLSDAGETRNGDQVLQCLQRALKIANGIMDANQKVALFVEILNKYLYFFENGCEAIGADSISTLIALIIEHVPSLDKSEEAQKAVAHYFNTVHHIKLRQQASEDGARYQAIRIPAQ